MRFHRISVGSARIELVKGDITLEGTDAIVTAANRRLAGGGGVDGAIHDAAGPGVMAEIRQRYAGGCATGDAVATGAGKLKSRILLHAVGPVYEPDRADWAAEMLRSAYTRCLQLAVENGCRSIAFPAISTGVYGYPIDPAARIALRAARDFLARGPDIDLVRWVLFNDAAFDAFLAAATEVLES